MGDWAVVAVRWSSALFLQLWEGNGGMDKIKKTLFYTFFLLPPPPFFFSWI